MAKTYRPGEKAPASGQYEIVGPRGGGTGKERTAIQGKPLPPTPQPRQQYRIADRTRNDSGRGR
ncbi:MAG: YjzC family protein [Actinomycetota bacterium]|nr:YjzC family protein [Actinomycetota bacterium]